MNMKLGIKIAAALVAMGLGAASATADSVGTVDAQELAGQVVTAGAGGVTVRGNTGETKLPLANVLEIQLAAGAGEIMGQNKSAVVVTAAGAKLSALELSLADGKLTFANGGLGRPTLDLASVRAILLPLGGKTPAEAAKICDELKALDRPMDVVVVQRKAGDFAALEGVLKGIDATAVTLGRGDRDARYPLTTVLAIRPAGATSQPAKAATGVLTLAKDGSAIAFSSVALDEQQCAAATAELGEVKVPRAAVAAIKFASDRLVNLSDLQPAEVKQTGFLDRVMPWRANASVGGGPIVLDGQRFGSGLGLHSACELTYVLDGAYSTLVATAGIDDAVRPAGNARLAVLGDGKERFAADLAGTGKASLIRVDVKGVKRLTIRVEFGADGLDVGDHVDLAAAKLVK